MEIEIKKIIVRANIRTRIDESDVSDLMRDIQQKGLLQPIGVTAEGNKFEMLYGNRRLQACIKLGYSKIEAKMFEGPLTKVQKIAINSSENIHREDVSPYEFARAVNSLLKEGLNKTEVAISLSVPITKIESALRIFARVPEIEGIETGYIPAGAPKNGLVSMSVLDALANLRLSPDKTKALLKEAHKNELSTYDIRLIGRLLSNGMTLESAIRDRGNYMTKNVAIVVRKDEYRGSEIDVWAHYVRAVLRGKTQPIKDLVF